MLMFINLTADNLEELGGRYNLLKTPFGDSVIGWNLVVRKCACRLTRHFYDLCNNEMFHEKFVVMEKTEGQWGECILRSDYLDCGHTEQDAVSEESFEKLAKPIAVEPQPLFEYTFEARLSYGRPRTPLDQVFSVRIKDRSLEQAKNKARLSLGETPSQAYWAFLLITVAEVSNRGYAQG